MKITIQGSPKEIAALVVAIQERQAELESEIPEKIIQHIQQIQDQAPQASWR